MVDSQVLARGVSGVVVVLILVFLKIDLAFTFNSGVAEKKKKPAGRQNVACRGFVSHNSFGHEYIFKSVLMAILIELLWPFRMAISTDLKEQMAIYAKYRFVKYRFAEP